VTKKRPAAKKKATSKKKVAAKKETTVQKAVAARKRAAKKTAVKPPSGRAVEAAGERPDGYNGHQGPPLPITTATRSRRAGAKDSAPRRRGVGKAEGDDAK
jgi:hypothetical protein